MALSVRDCVVLSAKRKWNGVQSLSPSALVSSAPFNSTGSADESRPTRTTTSKRTGASRATNPQSEKELGPAVHGQSNPVTRWRSLKANLVIPRQVQVMSTLPLKAVSRLWGRFNELEIPYYLRTPGFRLYSWIFGVK